MGDHRRGPPRAQLFGDAVETSQVLTDHRRNSDPGTDLENVHRALGDVHRLPPAHGGMQRAGDVVLLDLPAVEEPAVVLVLTVVRPLVADEDSDVDRVAGEAA